MMQLKHKQKKTLSKFFYNAVVNDYLKDSEIENMQLDVSDAIGATVQAAADEATNADDGMPVFPHGRMGLEDESEEEKTRRGDDLAHAMIRALCKADDSNTQLAMCVIDWSFCAFAMWHAGQYKYSRGKRDELMCVYSQKLILDHVARKIFGIGYTLPVDLPSWSGTVSAALDRFMAAYSTGKFPLDFTHDKIQVYRDEFGQLPVEIRGCLEKGARSSREWQRAFAAVGDRCMAEIRHDAQEGQQEHE